MVRLVKHSLSRDHLMWECLYLPSAVVEAHTPWHQQCGQAPTIQKNLTKANKLSETWRDTLHELWRCDMQLWFPNMVAHQDHLQSLLFFFFFWPCQAACKILSFPTRGSNLSSLHGVWTTREVLELALFNLKRNKNGRRKGKIKKKF